MNRWVGRDMGSEERTLAQTMLLTCGLFIGMAVTLRMDMLMTLFIILALHQDNTILLISSTPTGKMAQ